MESSCPAVPDVVLPRVRRDKVYTIVQSYPLTLVASTTVEVNGAITPMLSNLGDGASLAAVFDSYRLAGFRAKFTPVVNETLSAGGSTPLYTVLDWDDATTTTISNLLQYDTLKVATFGNYFERSIIPNTAIATYNGSVFTAFSSSTNWVDCANLGVPWYGIKYGIPFAGTAVTWYVQVECTFQFKRVR